MNKIKEKLSTPAANKKVTVYFEGGLGFAKFEARALAIEVGPYAQYSAAVTCYFIGKGKRNAEGFTQSYKPSLLVLEGWGHPEPDSIYLPAVPVGEGVAVARGRHSACSPLWRSEFDAMIAVYIENSGAKVVADYRGHNPHGVAPAVVETVEEEKVA